MARRRSCTETDANDSRRYTPIDSYPHIITIPTHTAGELLNDPKRERLAIARICL